MMFNSKTGKVKGVQASALLTLYSSNPAPAVIWFDNHRRTSLVKGPWELVCLASTAHLTLHPERVL